MISLYKYSDKEVDELLKSMVILVDTREHEGKNEHILQYFDKAGIAYKKKKLDYGDYSFLLKANSELSIPRDLDFSGKIIVERKSGLVEFSGNLTQDKARIEKELALAPKEKVVVIENNNYGDIISGNYDTKYNNKAFWAAYHSLWHKYNTPIVFMPDPSYTGFFIRGYFQYWLKNYMK